MDIKQFLDNYTSILCSPERDATFETMRVKYGGMASPRTAKLLNFAVQCMDEKEIYVEIGTHTGYTLLSAGYETLSRLIGIDDFRLSRNIGGEVVEPLELLKKNIQSTDGLNVSIAINEFRKVSLENEKNEGRSVGVFFIDADHNYKDVFDSFAWVEPFLSKDAIIILDDVRIEGVTEAMRDWLLDHEPYEEIFYCKTFKDKYMGRIGDYYFHNGIAIVRYHRD